MPKEYRAYDLDEDIYPVIGLVQNCYEITAPEGSMYRIGVAFVGKEFPDSYKNDPLQNYHICGTSPEGMWKITESGKKFQVRNAPRFWIATNVTLTFVRKERRVSHKENTATLNVSAYGASVYSRLRLKEGDKVKFADEQHNFYAIAVVRNRRDKPGRPSIMHLEFVDRRFPVERLNAPEVTKVTDQERETVDGRVPA